MTEKQYLKLRELLVAEFDEDGLTSLCGELGLNYGSLAGAGAFGKTRALLEAVGQKNMLPSLLARIRELRPAAYEAAGLRSGDARTKAATSPREEARPAESQPAPTVAAEAVGATGAGAQAAPAAGETPVVSDRQEMQQPVQSATAQPTSARPASAPGWVKTAAIVMVALLIVVIFLALVLPRPEGLTASPTADATLTPVVVVVPPPALAADSPITASVSDQTTAASNPVTATIALPATPTPRIVSSPTPQPTPTLSQTHLAAQTVVSLNQQLVDLYQGKGNRQDLEKYWSGEALQKLLDFLNVTVLRKVGVDMTKGQSVTVQLVYDNPPALAATGPDTFIVLSREYWRYANPKGTPQICETRDYTYTLVKQGEAYRVKDVKGDLIDTRCRN